MLRKLTLAAALSASAVAMLAPAAASAQYYAGPAHYRPVQYYPAPVYYGGYDRRDAWIAHERWEHRRREEERRHWEHQRWERAHWDHRYGW